MKFGIILYEVRDALGITNTEYLFLDAISKLQIAGRVPGWADASATYLTWVLGVDRRSFFRIQKRLVDFNLLDVLGNGNRRVTQLFASQLLAHKQENGSDKMPLPTQSGESSGKTPLEVVAKSHSTSGKTPPNNTDNTIILQCAPRARKKPSASSKIKKEKAPQVAAAPPALFANSPWANMKATATDWRDSLQALCEDLPGDLDTVYYYTRCRDWSRTKGGTSADWITTASAFAHDDHRKQKLATLSNNTSHASSNPTTPNNGNTPGYEGILERAIARAERFRVRNTPTGH